MKKYRTGKTSEGNDQFSIPLEADEDGMIGRECPNEECQPKYFKMSTTIPDETSKRIKDFSQIIVTCPYCGTMDNMQNYYTKSQMEWIKSMILRDAVKSIQDTLKSAFKPTRPTTKGMFSISFTYKPGSLPSVRHYVEQNLKRSVACDSCGYNYAVYGISFHCPLCGKGNLIQHLNRSAETIRVLIEESERIGKERGQEVRDQMVGNALEDVITLFETFLKHIYQYEMRCRLRREEAEAKIKKVGTTFQRLEGAEKLFSKDLGFELFGKCDQKDRAFLQDQFLKRHVLTHNLGLVDKKYIEKAQAYQKQGAEIDIRPPDVSRALDIVQDIVGSAIKRLEKSTK
jgi:predicted RNA-binding Zn-ribbon protein involved in translation (DUF1610 family)